MKYWLRILTFFILFSLAFFYLRDFVYENVFSTSFIGGEGETRLYSAFALIFGILIGFVIQREWEQWNSLADAVRREAEAIEFFWMWSKQLADGGGTEIRAHLKEYLQALIRSDWVGGSFERRNPEVDAALESIERVIGKISKEDQRTGREAVGHLSEVIRRRYTRVHYGGRHVPAMLRNVIIFAGALLVLLSFVVVVPNVWIDYAFTMSIGLMVFVLYIVIDDLDHPFRSGNWHLTNKDYKELLQKIS
jgi:hypothetical protein